MKEINSNYWENLNSMELLMVQGGGPIKDAVEWYYKSVGSFYRGIYDGLMGLEPAV
ncbi:MAG: hypothetical protein JSV73_04245 [Flavobacteriaceae bacterium]|nr:MAG: hypothetical protein JSV73_04245 [Flavobacteriaceae bacterium]